MKEWIKGIFSRIEKITQEEDNLIRFLRMIENINNKKVLDVGCGFGRILKELKKEGINALGIDINPKIVETNLSNGLDCITTHDFVNLQEMYDVIIMSHIIEHFSPDGLLIFIDNYLDRLKPGGYLVVATPLYTANFFDDFDHIRPYQPAGINMVFGNHDSQVQYYSRHSLKLHDIWFRKGPYKLNFSRGLYIRKSNKVAYLTNILLAILFKISFTAIGRKTGWMGLYKKVL